MKLPIWILKVVRSRNFVPLDIFVISKSLTFHIARHTFATTITLNNGVSIEGVSKMMGHTSIKTTQIYAKASDHKIGSDMQKIIGKVE